MPITLTIDKQTFDQATNAMAALSKRISDLRWLWPQMAGEYYKREQAWFDASGAGTWAALSEQYAKWKAKYYPGEPLLRLTGNLERSVVNRFSPDAVFEAEAKTLTLGSSVPYARAHHYGYPPRNLKARPVIDIDDSTEARMLDVAEREFADYCATLGFGVTR
jgi:phage gpG-like protein